MLLDETVDIAGELNATEGIVTLVEVRAEIIIEDVQKEDTSQVAGQDTDQGSLVGVI